MERKTQHGVNGRNSHKNCASTEAWESKNHKMRKCGQSTFQQSKPVLFKCIFRTIRRWFSLTSPVTYSLKHLYTFFSPLSVRPGQTVLSATQPRRAAPPRQNEDVLTIKVHLFRES